MGSMALSVGVQKGIPLDTLIVCKRANNTAGDKLLGLVINEPKGEFVTYVMWYTNPVSRTFFGRWPTVFMVKVEDMLPEVELEICRNVDHDAGPVLFRWHFIR